METTNVDDAIFVFVSGEEGKMRERPRGGWAETDAWEVVFSVAAALVRAKRARFCFLANVVAFFSLSIFHASPPPRFFKL